MRRAAGLLAVCLCAASACRGSAGQEPGDRAVGSPAPAPPAPAANEGPIASEVDVRRAIAFISDEPSRAGRRGRPVTVAERKPPPPTRVVRESEGDADVHVVMHDPAAEHAVSAKPTIEERPAAPKACSGVVNRRS